MPHQCLSTTGNPEGAILVPDTRLTAVWQSLVDILLFENPTIAPTASRFRCCVRSSVGILALRAAEEH